MEENQSANLRITGKAVVTIRNPDGTIKHVEEMEVKTE
jgi:hypothetical protein